MTKHTRFLALWVHWETEGQIYYYYYYYYYYDDDDDDDDDDVNITVQPSLLFFCNHSENGINK